MRIERAARWAFLFLVGAVVMVATCACGGGTPEPAEPRIVLERRACLAAPPPTAGPAVSFPACPAPHGDLTCLDPAAAIELALWLKALDDYARDAWISCGPEPVAKEDDPP